ncbi:DUF2306 domain-containing protein [Acrocarpospora pleiomorpha]|uniref:DUF2306 domain-containing protein n=1 Tax=Acrocarpospora pleiomorpha TaxID=90975 RepID=UPI0012D2FC48|nr:DUF2306 domain-containing protein [Acrocarpospora pleiomorpha]
MAGLTCVLAGATAAFSRKGGRTHIRYGRIYLWGLGALFVSMTVMSAIRWRENAPLFALGCAAMTAALTGYLNRRNRPALHIAGMGLSYVALLTGFYVDNGPHLPLWNRLPPLALWLLPALIGAPIIIRAIRLGLSDMRRISPNSGIDGNRIR